jgi:hypothetical protein
MRALHDEYLRRIREVKKNQFLSFFLQKHPGIQHKAGVQRAGHSFSCITGAFAHFQRIDIPDLTAEIVVLSVNRSVNKAEVDTVALTNALGRIGTAEQFVKDPTSVFWLAH